MPRYVVVDGNNNWLVSGEFNDPKEAYEDAKYADEYDPYAKVYVYEVVRETGWGPERREVQISLS